MRACIGGTNDNALDKKMEEISNDPTDRNHDGTPRSERELPIHPPLVGGGGLSFNAVREVPTPERRRTRRES